jgi:hypothetical protein
LLTLNYFYQEKEVFYMGIVKKGWLLLGVLTLLGCTSKVELDIFSGVPNPAWMLTQHEASELKSMISRLDQTEDMGQCPQNLGYRGFIIRTTAASSVTVQTIRACHGLIEVVDTARTSFYIDPMRQIELWLLTTAKPPLADDLYDEIVNEIMEGMP